MRLTQSTLGKGEAIDKLFSELANYHDALEVFNDNYNYSGDASEDISLIADQTVDLSVESSMLLDNIALTEFQPAHARLKTELKRVSLENIESVTQLLINATDNIKNTQTYMNTAERHSPS